MQTSLFKLPILAITLWRRLGLRGALRYAFFERMQPYARWIGRAPGGAYALPVRGVAHPLLCRPQTSDRWAFGQVFIHRQYATLPNTLDPKLIVDCGANVGYASVFFLTRFPQAHLIAVEPDPDNVELLRQNLAPYGPRAKVIQAAIWSEAVGLIVEHSRVERNAQWGTWVRPSLPHETSDVNGIDLASLLVESGHHAIDIVKMDIEGAETAIFAQDCRSWLDSVAVIEIELHGDEGERLFRQALGPDAFHYTVCGEITVAMRTAPVKETNAAFGRHR
ncbi:MAG: FkbM family methyltransferase [Caldilinea sp.]